MSKISRRIALGAITFASLARTQAVHAQTAGKPIKIGLLSDLSGPYRENGGPGSKVATEMAIEDLGGSLLGRPLQVMQADNQNKPDLASSIAREWIDAQGVDLLVDGASSAAGLAIQQVAREKKRIYTITSPISNVLVGKQCSPYSFQFIGNTYALTKAVADTVTRQGGDSWFIIAVDYEAGYALQNSMEEFIKGAGGKVVGAVRTPLGTTDFSSFLIQAKNSGAKVVGFGLGGELLQNCIKQAAEFGIGDGGQTLATPILVENDVFTVGQDACRGLMASSSFYWDLSPESRAWSQRYIAKAGKLPEMYQAAAYSAVLHWLKAVRAATTLDADVVAAKMRAMPVNDFFNNNVQIQANGSVPLTMYLFSVKSAAQAKSKQDIYNLRGTLPSPQAYPPPALFGCQLA